MVALIADGGEITVGRQMATYVYGAWEVNAPDDVEEEERDDRLDWGFIYRPDNRPTGRFDLAFVRADASMDMELGKSDTEQVIDTATKRVSGDVFFEREISGAGLGRWVPGKHFRTGDIVDVRLWWRTLALPVTAIDLATKKDEPLGYAVHVGGQVIADAEKLRQHNDKIEQAIAADRRKQAKELGAVRSTANTAKATAERLREDLGVPDGSEGGLFGQYLDKLGEDGDVTKDLATINALLWDDQRGWNATQEAINEAQAQINALTEGRLNDQEQIVEALRQAQEAQLLERRRILFAYQPSAADSFWSVAVPSSAGPTLTAKGNWAGTVFVTHVSQSENSMIHRYEIPRPDGTRTVTLPSISGSNHAVQLDYIINGGVQKRRDITSRTPFTIQASAWTIDDRHTFTVPVTGRYAIYYAAKWSSPQNLANYGIDIERNNTTLKSTGLAGHFLPSGSRTLNVATEEPAALLNEGDVITFRAFAGTSYEPGRTLEQVTTKITWVAPS